MLGGGGKKRLKKFIAGTLVWSRQSVQIPCQNEPKCANSLPWQGKCQSNSSPGVVGENKFDFSTRGILARPRHALTYPAKQCLGKKTPWHWLASTTILNYIPNLHTYFHVTQMAWLWLSCFQTPLLQPGFEPTSVELKWPVAFWRMFYQLSYLATAK